MKYGVFESTNPYGSRLYDAVCDTDVENGTVGYIEELAEGEAKIFKFVKGVVAGKQLVVVDQPAWDADTCKTSNQRKDKFIVEAGTPFRVRELIKYEKFAISAECVEEKTRKNLDVNTYLTVNTDGKFVVSSSSDENAVFEAKVLTKRNTGGVIATAANNYGYVRTMYVVRVTNVK